jgi:hypothetical protein
LIVFVLFCPMQAKNNKKIISISKLFTSIENNQKFSWSDNWPQILSAEECSITVQCSGRRVKKNVF